MSDVKHLEVQVYARKAGSAAARVLRRQEMIPAVVYGPGQKTISLSLDLRAAEKYSKREYENKIFTFKSEQKDLNGLKVLKKETSYHIVTRQPQHIDFLSLDMSKKVRVLVEVSFMGKARGVKESGGVLNVQTRGVEVECLPGEIPESFSIDVSELDLNQNFHVSDLNIPKNIRLITDKKTSLCAVVQLAEEEEEKPTTQAAAESTTEESETTEKPEDQKAESPPAKGSKSSE